MSRLAEIPASQRTRQANLLLAKPSSFWVARAKRQIDHTGYRLIYRNFYYGGFNPNGFGAGGTKEMMPLTQPELWNVTLNGAPVRPAARDATETGGRYSLYFASVVDGDAAAQVDCN